MKGAVIQEASAHRSCCDGLTKGIYVAFKCINKGVLNNRKRGDFTFIAAPLKPSLKQQNIEEKLCKDMKKLESGQERKAEII